MESAVSFSLTVAEMPTQEYLAELLQKLMSTAGERRLIVNVYVHP